MLFPTLNVVFFYNSIFRSTCTVPNMVLVYSSLTSYFPGVLFRNFLNYFEMVPVVPVITDITSVIIIIIIITIIIIIIGGKWNSFLLWTSVYKGWTNVFKHTAR